MGQMSHPQATGLDCISSAFLNNKVALPFGQRLKSFHFAVLTSPLQLVRSLTTHTRMHTATFNYKQRLKYTQNIHIYKTSV